MNSKRLALVDNHFYIQYQLFNIWTWSIFFKYCWCWHVKMLLWNHLFLKWALHKISSHEQKLPGCIWILPHWILNNNWIHWFFFSQGILLPNIIIYWIVSFYFCFLLYLEHLYTVVLQVLLFFSKNHVNILGVGLWREKVWWMILSLI